MKIPKNYDPVSGAHISYSRGTNPQDNPGIQPSEKAIADTPGEKATNEQSAHEMTKGQNFGKGGSGYTK